MRTIPELIIACGGPEKIVAAAGDNPATGVPRLSHWAIRKWAKNGIPEWHWALVKALVPDASPTELHAANEAIRALPVSREPSPKQGERAA